MGYSYGVNWRTGLEVLCCQICGTSDGTAKKVRCPYNYCPAVAACANCREAKKHLHNAEQKADCKASHDKFEAEKDFERSNPDKIVRAAWGNWCTKMPGVVLVMTGDEKYHLVRKYEVKRPNLLSNSEYVSAIETDGAEALISAAH